MNLFDLHREEQLKQEALLAGRVRPRDFANFVGQEHLVGGVLRKST
jgi:replication-associated recombination protein RarA